MQIIEHRVEPILFVIRCERPRYLYLMKMCSALQVVLFLAVTSVSRTVAEIPCPSDISEKLKQCYEGGIPPQQRVRLYAIFFFGKGIDDDHPFSLFIIYIIQS